MEIEGTIVQILEKRSGISKSTGNPWMSQGYVLMTNELHSKKIAFEVTGEDRIRRFGLQVGSYVKVFCEVESREYEGKWYTSVKAWDARGVVRAQNTQAAPQAAPAPQEAAAPAQGAPTMPPPPTMSQAPSTQAAPTDTDDAPF